LKCCKLIHVLLHMDLSYIAFILVVVTKGHVYFCKGHVTHRLVFSGACVKPCCSMVYWDD
jgi:hypothetical protein